MASAWIGSYPCWYVRDAVSDVQLPRDVIAGMPRYAGDSAAPKRPPQNKRNVGLATGLKKFSVNVPDAKVLAIRQRMASAVLPRQMPPASPSDSMWETGMDIAWLNRLRTYWVNQFDWGAAQARLNRFEQYTAEIDGLDIHFYYVRGENNPSRTILLIHGWPGSVVEFLNLIEPLSAPSKSGGDAADAFNVIVPSLPGFGFSSMPEKPINSISTAKLFDKLVNGVLGHKRYFVQGGDFGGGVAVQLAHLFPDHVAGLHLNFVPWFDIPDGDRSPAEKEWLAVGAAYAAREFDYMKLQANKTMMPAVALADSPLGAAAWIAEKFWAWSDNGGDLDKIIPMDTLITNIMLYLVGPGAIDGSLWFYRGFRDEMGWSFFPGYINTPTAISIFPRDYPVSSPPLETAKRGFNVVHYAVMPSGGHFASLEKPDVLLKEILSSFRSVTI